MPNTATEIELEPMTRLPRITAAELLQALRKDGLKTGTMSSILDQAGITAEELRRLL